MVAVKKKNHGYRHSRPPFGQCRNLLLVYSYRKEPTTRHLRGAESCHQNIISYA